MNKEKKKAYMKEYNQFPESKKKKKEYSDKPENKAKKKVYMKEYNQLPEHKKKKKEYRDEHKKEIEQHRWEPENKKKKNVYDKRYKKEHPEECNINNHKRKARIKGNGGSYTIEEITQLRKETKGICKGWKRKPHFVGDKNLTIDHIIAITKGGTNNIENIQLLCKHCNPSKGTN